MTATLHGYIEIPAYNISSCVQCPDHQEHADEPPTCLRMDKVIDCNDLVGFPTWCPRTTSTNVFGETKSELKGFHDDENR